MREGPNARKTRRRMTETKISQKSNFKKLLKCFASFITKLLKYFCLFYIRPISILIPEKCLLSFQISDY